MFLMLGKNISFRDATLIFSYAVAISFLLQ